MSIIHTCVHHVYTLLKTADYIIALVYIAYIV